MTQTKPDRVVRHLSIAYFVPFQSPDGNKAVLVRTARRGEMVDTSTFADGEVQRLEDLGAFLPAGATSQDAEREGQARLDAYRGERGDLEALERHQQRLAGSSGDIVNVDAPVDASAAELAAYVSENKLTVDDTVALADGDPDRARKVLEAENIASGGSPRAGVEQKLQALIG